MHGVRIDDVPRHAFETGLDDEHELVVGVARKGDAGEAKAGADFVAEGAFGQVHGVGDGEDDEAAVPE